MGICAKSRQRQQSRLLCRYCVWPVEYPFLSTTTTYAVTGAEDLVRMSAQIALRPAPLDRQRRVCAAAPA
jgi:hypothetical protein